MASTQQPDSASRRSDRGRSQRDPMSPRRPRHVAAKVLAATVLITMFSVYAKQNSYEPLSSEERALVGEWFLTHDLGHRDNLGGIILSPDLVPNIESRTKAAFPKTPSLVLRSNRTVSDVSDGQINRRAGTWHVVNDRLILELQWPAVNVHRSVRDNFKSITSAIASKWKKRPNRNPVSSVDFEIIRSNQVLALRELSPYYSFDHGPIIDSVFTRSRTDADRLDNSEFAATYAELDSPLHRLRFTVDTR